RRARDVDEVHDLLRVLGPLTVEEVAARVVDEARPSVPSWLDQLAAERRAFATSMAGDTRWAAGEDAGRLRDALGCAIPVGLPAAYTDPVDDPLLGLVVRHGRTHGPFLVREAAARLGLAEDRVRPVLDRLVSSGGLTRGEFRPGGADREWCDP